MTSKGSLGREYASFAKARLELFELSVEAGRDRVFLSNLENGKHEPKLGTIKRLADSLGISISQLMRGL